MSSRVLTSLVYLAVALSLVFTMLVLQKFEAAGIFGIVVLLTLLGWHAKEPQEG